MTKVSSSSVGCTPCGALPSDGQFGGGETPPQTLLGKVTTVTIRCLGLNIVDLHRNYRESSGKWWWFPSGGKLGKVKAIATGGGPWLMFKFPGCNGDGYTIIFQGCIVACFCWKSYSHSIHLFSLFSDFTHHFCLTRIPFLATWFNLFATNDVVSYSFQVSSPLSVQVKCPLMVYTQVLFHPAHPISTLLSWVRRLRTSVRSKEPLPLSLAAFGEDMEAGIHLESIYVNYIHPSAWMYVIIQTFVCLSVCPSVCLSVRLSVCSVCLFCMSLGP